MSKVIGFLAVKGHGYEMVLEDCSIWWCNKSFLPVIGRVPPVKSERLDCSEHDEINWLVARQSAIVSAKDKQVKLKFG